MTSANLPNNLETTPLFKEYVSNVKKQLVKTKQNSESKRQGTRLQVARKSTSWHRPSKISPNYIEATAVSPTPVISEATVNSKSLLSPICEGENGTENGSNEKNGEKERARSDGTNSPIDDHHGRQATSDSPLYIQHSPKDITEDEEKEKEEEEEEENLEEEEEDVCKQISRVINMAASEASKPENIDTDDENVDISTISSEFDKTNKLDNELRVKIEEKEQTQNEDSSSSTNQNFNQHTSSNKKSHQNHDHNSYENKKEGPDKEKKEDKQKDSSKQSSKVTCNSMETAKLSTPENNETTDSTTPVRFEGVVDIKQQDQDKMSEEKEKFKRKLSNDNNEHVSREKTIRNCSPPPESFKEEDKPC